MSFSLLGSFRSFVQSTYLCDQVAAFPHLSSLKPKTCLLLSDSKKNKREEREDSRAQHTTANLLVGKTT